MTDKAKLIEQLNGLEIDEWAELVGAAADHRFNKLRQTNSNAATFYEISRQCQRLRKILKRVTI